MKNKQVIAAFDFDGTITKKDTFLPFLNFMFGTYQTKARLAFLSPKLLFTLFQKEMRKEAKECLLTHFLQGESLASLEEASLRFTKGPMQQLFRQAALEKIQWHKNQGHRLVLISANFSFLLKTYSKEAGFDHLIASQATLDVEGKITGKLQYANCYGIEKAKALEEWLKDRSQYVLYAYGDSAGDRELLQLADFPFYRKFS